LGAQPEQLLSYYVWAENAGPDGKNRRTIRGYRTQAKTLERLRNDHAVRHELVDDTP